MLRKPLLLLALAAGLPTLALAMPGGDDHAGPGAHQAGTYHELNLSTEQQQEMHRLMRAQRQQQREITQRYLDKLPEAQRKALMQERQTSREAGRQAIRKLLDADQQKRFDQMAQAHEQRRQEFAEFQKWKAEHGKQP